jgi:hypothetical protein
MFLTQFELSFLPLLSSCLRNRQNQELCVTFRSMLLRRLLYPPPPQLARAEDHPLSTACHCLVNTFADTLHMWRPSTTSVTRGHAFRGDRHAHYHPKNITVNKFNPVASVLSISLRHNLILPSHWRLYLTNNFFFEVSNECSAWKWRKTSKRVGIMR